MQPLFRKQYRTVSAITGPILIAENLRDAAYGELAEIRDAQGTIRRAQVLEVDGSKAVLEVFEDTGGLDLAGTSVRLLGETARFGVSTGLLGRCFDGSGRPYDGLPAPLPEALLDVHGSPMNPFARMHPNHFIETGLSVLDTLNTLLRGQKLPIFSGSGLPASQLALQIATQSQAPGTTEKFAIVFSAIGITHRESTYFVEGFERSGSLDHSVVFLSLADAPAIERLLTPRLALTAAEYLAFVKDYHVLVVMTDMIHYCEALREISTARAEVPGRRGYPGYLYTDLASLYERAGCLRGFPGSITQITVLTMPEDDITHPVPDLTGYITEGQIVLSRDLHQRNIYPPVDVLPSLSRLMHAGIGAGKTREDHGAVADQLYASYARGCDLRKLVAIIGDAAISSEDRSYLEFADQFERKYIHQGTERRSIEESLDLAWSLFTLLPRSDLKRLDPALIDRLLPTGSNNLEGGVRTIR